MPTLLAGGECCLRQLDVSFNRLGDEGAAALAGLVGSTPLVALELEGNQVGGNCRRAGGVPRGMGGTCSTQVPGMWRPETETNQMKPAGN